MPQVPYLFQRKQSLNGLFDETDEFFTIDDGAGIDYGSDDGSDTTNYDNVIFVDDYGNTVDASGNVLISADELTTIAAQNPGGESQAVAQVMQTRAPNWVANINDTNSLLVAASGLWQNVKNVVSGKPASVNNPYVQPYYRATGLAPAPAVSQTTILLIGAALLAFFILRKKS